MKRKITVLAVSVMLLLSMLLLNSCLLLGYSIEGKDGDGGADSSLNGGGSQLGNVTVNGGDNYNVTINSSGQQNALAGSKAVLSTVSVYSEFKRSQWGSTTEASASGAGVIYKLDKNSGTAYIITNYHVVYDAYCNTKNKISDNINIYLYGQEATKYAIPAKFIGGSMNYDIAVLKVEGSEVIMKSSAVAATVSDSDKISVLETAIAVGNPEGIGLSATVGVISVDSENISISMIYGGSSRTITLRCIRIDAAVNSGNSGGGLFNASGDLIGIVNAKLSDDSVDNIGYAIPSNVARAVADNIIDYCDGTDKENVYRCLLGVNVAATESRADYDTETGKITKVEKVVISEISDTGAAKGVFYEYDVINSITINGEKHAVTRVFHVIDSMLDARVGSTVVFNITRDGKSMDITVPITESMLTAY